MSRRQWADDSTRCLKFNGNASVTLSFKGNLFDLMPEERNLIADLTAVIQKYEEEKHGPVPCQATA
jgi:hypothetical protein